MRRTLTVSAMLLAIVPALIGCQKQDEQAATANPTQSAASPSAKVLLAKVYYGKLLTHEFAYEADGKPRSLKGFNPVTGAISSELVVAAVNDAGQVTEAVDTSNGTKTKVVYAYDGDGRRTAITRYDQQGNELSRSSYAQAGNVITQTIAAKGRADRSMVYTLDDGGNVVSQRWINGTTDQTHTFGDFDSAPNPFTFTAGLYDAYPLAKNNYRTDATYAGCEFTTEHTYADGLLVASKSTGCVGPNGKPTVHEYRYEYTKL